MRIQCWAIGKSHEPYVKEGVELFTKRISNYFPATWKILSPPRNAGHMEDATLKKKEGEIIISTLLKEDYLVVLDERGKQFTSEGVAKFLEQRLNESGKNLVFLIGGAYGVSDQLLQRADLIWSLSQLVFPHQLVRLILAEQLYRACSIIRNEKYHHS